MASINSLTTPQHFHPLSKHKIQTKQPFCSSHQLKPFQQKTSRISQKKLTQIVFSLPKDFDATPLQKNDIVDQKDEIFNGLELEKVENDSIVNQVVSGFGNNELEGMLSFEGAGAGSGFAVSGSEEGGEKLIDRGINATIVLAAGTFAVTKLLTVDCDYWHGWTLYEILRYAPQHNWSAYEEALKTNPVLAKMVISGIVYSVGDWIAQCCEGKPLFEFDRLRMLRSGLVGFTLHGSLSHYYYHFCEALFPFQDWWVVPAKVLFDQTVWAAIWNSIYFILLGVLRFESPITIFTELKSTFTPMLTAGWKLWPFAHLVTYGLIPVEQRLLWVDCVELIWVTILSTISEELLEPNSITSPPDHAEE
ncbi:hypothetical protein Leryth_013548 [Lithospermum erythrorhizon]|nr:hypothetical protein Leryth_013548 [Lithospermum erythrorhizon]